MTKKEFVESVVNAAYENYDYYYSRGVDDFYRIVIGVVNSVVYSHGTSPRANWYKQGPYFGQRRRQLLSGVYVRYDDEYGEYLFESNGLPNKSVCVKDEGDDGGVYSVDSEDGEEGFFDMLGASGHSGFLRRNVPIVPTVAEKSRPFTDKIDDLFVSGFMRQFSELLDEL